MDLLFKIHLETGSYWHARKVGFPDTFHSLNVFTFMNDKLISKYNYSYNRYEIKLLIIVGVQLYDI